MPELPDVEVFRRVADPQAFNQSVQHVEARDPGLLDSVTPQALGQALTGHALQASRRHGKLLFLGSDSGAWLVLHFGMSGNLSYLRKGADEPRYTRLVLEFDGGTRLTYENRRRLGRITLADDPESFVRNEGLGPDAWTLDLAGFRAVLAGKRGAVKPALMDQATLAGLGNIYTDEILFQAGIDPRRPVAELTESALEALHATMDRVLHEAVEHRADPERMPEGWLLPHREADAACPRCGSTLQTPKVGGRTTYVCPHCQNGRG